MDTPLYASGSRFRKWGFAPQEHSILCVLGLGNFLASLTQIILISVYRTNCTRKPS